MREIEKMKRYIDKHEVPRGKHYGATFGEVRAMAHELDAVEAVVLAFEYGKSKGYRAAKAEVRR